MENINNFKEKWEKPGLYELNTDNKSSHKADNNNTSQKQINLSQS